MEFTIDGNHYQIRDADELMAVAKVTGGNFFNRETMRAFKSKLEPKIFEAPEGIYFVTSERFESVFLDHKEPRRWTIRLFNPEGNIRSVKKDGENGFQRFNSCKQAYRYIEKNLIKKDE